MKLPKIFLKSKMKPIWIQFRLTPAGSFIVHYDSSVTIEIAVQFHNITS